MINYTEFDYLDMQTTVTIVADSYNDITDSRATTALIRLPRFILPQMNTHRKFARNVGSSRAKRFLQNAKNMTYQPIIWLENHKGMSAEFLVPGWKANVAKFIWRSSAWSAFLHGYALDKLGISKQYSNRIIEPYCYTDYLVTSTEWENFFRQRDDSHAQYEIQIVARRLKKAIEESVPRNLLYGEWHLPFISDKERYEAPDVHDLIKVSCARSARTSYSTNGYHKDFAEDIKLYNKLVKDKPPHLSPTEHQLCAVDMPYSGNIDGFLQYRKLVEMSYAPNGHSIDKLMQYYQ